MNEQKIINLLSMAQRAGKVVSGDFDVNKAVKARKAKMMLVAQDTAQETREKHQHLAEAIIIDCYYLLDRDQLGHCIGKDFRAVAGITDGGFAKAMAKLCQAD